MRIVKRLGENTELSTIKRGSTPLSLESCKLHIYLTCIYILWFTYVTKPLLKVLLLSNDHHEMK